jgi:phosphatidylglycerophosphate synthase
MTPASARPTGPSGHPGAWLNLLAVTATALTATRLALAAPLGMLMADSDAVAVAAVVLAVGVGSDLLDGPAARAAGAAGPRGQLFDHTTDCVFVTAGLAGAAARDAVPWLLPVFVTLSFVQYVADSRASAVPGLRGNRLGHLNGVLYFAPIGADLLARGGVVVVTAGAVRLLAWLLIGSTLVSMAQRGWYVIRARRRVRGSPGAGTPSRPRR